jgi:transcriptional regulator with XRE-family HTH domain
MGLSQKKLATTMGISPTALNYYEKGKCEPNILALMNLAKVLNVTADALLGMKPKEDLIAQNRDEHKALCIFRELNTVGQKRFLEFGTSLKDAPKFTKADD